MKRFVAFFIFIGFVGFAHAELDSSILEPFSDNDIVVIGTVIQIIEDDTNTRYDIKTEEFLKGQLSFDMITATLNQVRPSDFPQDPLDYYNKPFFEKGNQVLVYLKQEGGTFEMSPYSFTIKKPSVAGPPTVIHPTGPQEHINSQGDEIIISGTIKKGYLYGLAKSDLNSDFNLVILNENEEQVESKKMVILPDGSYSFSFQDRGKLHIPGKYSWEITYHNGGMGGEFFVTGNLDLWAPLKQFKSGIPVDEIECKGNLVLIQKSSGSPACIKESTINKLIKRDWTNLAPKTCPDGYSYNETLFRCVVLCEGSLAYNGYTDSCTTEFELKYHGYCDEEFMYNPSSHTCYSGNGTLQTPLKDPPRTAPPEPKSEKDLAIENIKQSILTDASYDKWRQTIQNEVDEKNLEPFSEIMIVDMKEDLEQGEGMSFNLVTFGYRDWCIMPKISIYHQDYDAPIYEYGVVHTCPAPDGSPNPYINIRDEGDFGTLPWCQFDGRYTIWGESFEFESQPIGSFYCNSPEKFKVPETFEIIIPQGSSDIDIKNNFIPSELELRYAEHLKIINRDDSTHEVILFIDKHAGAAVFSTRINPGEIFTEPVYRFGTFELVSWDENENERTWMHGVVTVKEN